MFSDKENNKRNKRNAFLSEKSKSLQKARQKNLNKYNRIMSKIYSQRQSKLPRIVTGGKVRAAKRLPRKSLTCSMGLRSGDRASQSIRTIPHSPRSVRQLLCDDMVHCRP
ncbi:hypothetical protein TNCV_2969541 [Trichonephila clavipes]|nr:hypothetical protein TNCV_2969541 [Trichonephila clavipes]